jgi:predicted hydrocarbon binding protein
MKVWGDPSLFIPSKAFVNLFKNLENKLGAEKTHEIFYWLGKLYGKNCTLMLKNRFGISKSDIPNFVNGATQDGFGYMQIKYYDAEKARTGEVIGTNSRFAIKYSSIQGKSNEPIDYYISGILAGGSEPLFDLFIDVKETSCMAQGKKECVYSFKGGEQKPKFNFFKNIKLKEDYIQNKTKIIMLTRKSEFKILGKKEIKFGDGTFIFKNQEGFNFPVYGMAILMRILEDILKEAEISEILRSFAKDYLSILKESIFKSNLQDILKELEIFCYGKFAIEFNGSKRMILSNQTNQYAKNYLEIFGRTKNKVDKFIVLMLEELFKLNNKRTIVKELSCKAKGDKACTFEITFL